MFFWIKLGIVAVVLAALTWAGYSWLESVKEKGREEIRTEWRQAVEKQKQLEAAAAAAAAKEQALKEADRAKAYAVLRSKNKALEAKLAVACVDPTLLAGMRESVRTANNQGPGEPPASAAIAAGTPDGNQVNDWFLTVTELYRACREQVIGWIKWDDARVGG